MADTRETLTRRARRSKWEAPHRYADGSERPITVEVADLNGSAVVSLDGFMITAYPAQARLLAAAIYEAADEIDARQHEEGKDG